MSHCQKVSVLIAFVLFMLPVVAQSQGQGIVQLEGQVYKFDVSLCTFHSDQEVPARMIYGTGTSPDGKFFTVDLVATQKPEGEEHIVNLHLPGHVLSAQYRQTEVGWISTEGPADGPLIQAEDSRVVAGGIFVEVAAEKKVVVASVEVTCSH